MRKITLGILNVSEQGKRYVNDVLDSNRLSSGKYTAQLERQFATEHGMPHGIFCNSGTSALQIALAALKEVHGYRDGDEVLVPATTFIATSNVVIQNNLVPVFVDVDERTFNMNPAEIIRHITKRTRCIIPVHLFGLPADMSLIKVIADTRALQIIEDSCETMFALCDDRPVGSFGDMACFSTYVAHLIVGGIGGLVLTNDSKLEALCRSLMAHGRDSIYTNIDQDDTENSAVLRQMIDRRYRFERVGYSYRCTELEAAIALSEMERWQANICTRRANAALLTDLLSDIPVLQLPFIPSNRTHSFMMYPMVLKEGDTDRLLLFLEERGIETRYLFPLLEQPIYRKLFPGEADKYVVSRNLARHGFFIGMHQGLTGEDIHYVSDVFHEYFLDKAY